MSRGHRVLVVTHSYGDRVGVRYLTNFLKVFYLPIVPFYNKAVLPTIVCSLPSLRHIFLTEGVTLVHGHAAFSSLAHEALMVGSLLGLPTVFTDHSLFGFSDASAVVTNTFLKFSLANTSHTICVSHTGKENTVLRTSVPPDRVSVIPNAVDSVMFRPGKARSAGGGVVTLVIGSRLVYRKGIDLVVQVLPRLCSQRFGKKGDVRVDVLVCGDGPKRILLEEMVEQHDLQDRVTMLGELKHDQMRDRLLVKGDIFLNCSLTEAFCMAILEAASCGLAVVSTAVGGIPEVLPKEYIYLVEARVDSILAGLERAVADTVEGRRPCPWGANFWVAGAYSWRRVAERTEAVYRGASGAQGQELGRRVRNMWEAGRVAGPVMAVLYLLCHYLLVLLAWWMPL